MTRKNQAARRVWLPILLLLAAALLAALALRPFSGRAYTLHLPSSADVSELILRRGGEETRLAGWEEIGTVTGLLLGDGRTTARESVQDAPVNAENCIQLDYVFSGGGASTLFAYERRGAHWLEQPYNGIYSLSEEEFGALLALLAQGAPPADG